MSELRQAKADFKLSHIRTLVEGVPYDAPDSDLAGRVLDILDNYEPGESSPSFTREDSSDEQH